METEVESSNIHFKWLDNIYNQFMKLQEMEILSLEGCQSLMEYLQVPFELKMIVLPDIQYKNLRFMIHEINMLICNLSPVLKEVKTKEYLTRLNSALENINERGLFLKDIKKDNYLVQINLLPFFSQTLNYVLKIKSDIIIEKEVSEILYMKEDTNKKW